MRCRLLVLFLSALVVRSARPAPPAASCPFCAPAGAEAASATAPSAPGARRPDPIYHQSTRWETDTGAAFEFSQLQGRPALIALFYTSCHVACPITVQALADVDRALPAGSPVAIVLVTIDPVTDTAVQLAECRRDHRLSGRVILLRGSLADTQRLADAAGITFRREPMRLFHVPKIVVLDPMGQVCAEFPGLQLNGAAIARRVVQVTGPHSPPAALLPLGGAPLSFSN